MWQTVQRLSTLVTIMLKTTDHTPISHISRMGGCTESNSDLDFQSHRDLLQGVFPTMSQAHEVFTQRAWSRERVPCSVYMKSLVTGAV